MQLKLKAIRSDLIRAVYRARKVAPEKGTMPILGHVVLRADKELNRLLVEGTDLMTGVSGVLVADVEQGGAIAVGASAFYRIVDAATSDVVEIQGDETALLIRSGRSKWKLPTMLAADHPGMPRMKGAGESTEFDSETLRSALSQSAYAVSKFNDGNEATKGVLFQSRGGKLRTVSTDGRRLAAVFTEIEDLPEFDHVLSADSVEAIIRFLSEAKGPVTFQESSPYVSFSRVMQPGGKEGEGVETRVTCKTLQVTFPPYERMIAAQESLRYTVHVHRETLQQSIRRVVVAVKDKGAHVMIELYSDGGCLLFTGGRYLAVAGMRLPLKS